MTTKIEREEAPMSASDRAVINLEDRQDGVVNELCERMARTAQRHRDVRVVLNFESNHAEVIPQTAAQNAVG